MKTTLATNIAPLSSTDKDGVQWTFDFETQRWKATVGKKSMSSKSYSTLRDKVNEAKAGQEAKSKDLGKRVEDAPAPLEVALIRVSLDTRYSVGEPRLTFQPIIAKVEWDASEGAMTIVRYKELENQGGTGYSSMIKTSESGWKSSNASNLMVIHPNFLSQEMRALLEQQVQSTIINNAFAKVKDAVSKAWWESKEDTTLNWTHSNQHGIKQEKMPTPGQHVYRRDTQTSKDWVSVISSNTNDFSDWIPNDAGHLARGEVEVRMNVDGFSPTFGVYMTGKSDLLFENPNLDLVLQIAQATYHIHTQPGAAVEQWMGKSNWENTRGATWPEPITVQGGAVVIEPRDRSSNWSESTAVSYMLCQDNPERDRFARKDIRENRDLADMSWRRVSGYRSDISLLRPAGPEDQALDVLKKLSANRKQTRKAAGLKTMTTEILAQACANTLSEVCGAIEDGEDLLSTLNGIAEQHKRVATKISQGIENSDVIVKWNDTCERAREQAMKTIGDVDSRNTNGPAKSKPSGPR